jgi:hypothetical protein
MKTPKQRMLDAYRGIPADRPPVAPELWYYYPAKLLGVDMETFRRMPFHQALKKAFAVVGCEGWGCTFAGNTPSDVEVRTEERRLDADRIESCSTIRTPYGPLTSVYQSDRREAGGWAREKPIKDFDRDLKAWEYLRLGGDPQAIDFSRACADWAETGDAFLLEFYIGDTFYDWFGTSCEGDLEMASVYFLDHEKELEALQERYIDNMIRRTRAVCTRTPFESLFIGCTWSCMSLISPATWRRWDKPVIRAICDEAHRHGRLVHVHLHGKSLAVVDDFPEIGIDCVCPFERGPGGDVNGLAGLKEVARRLAGRTTMNGNIHTVETLIRGTPADVRREVNEVLEAFAGNPRVIVGTGDQVGRETPAENLAAMVDAVVGGGARKA